MTPNADDLRFAAEWLRAYDDSHEGGQDMARAAVVADWLEEQADAKEMRAAARQLGVPMNKLRELVNQSTQAALPTPQALPAAKHK